MEFLRQKQHDLRNYFFSNGALASATVLRLGISLHCLVSYIFIYWNLPDVKYFLHYDHSSLKNFIFSNESLIIIIIIFSFLLLLGLFIRTSLFILFFCTIFSIQQMHHILAGYDLLIPYVLFLLFFMNSSYLSLSRFLRMKTENDYHFYVWPQRLIQILIAIIYFTANINRLDSDLWNEGKMALAVLKNISFSYVSGFEWERHSLLLVFGSYAARIIEISGILIPFSKKLRPYLSLVLIFLHLSLALTINITGWQFFMIALHLSCLKYQEPEKLSTTLKSKKKPLSIKTKNWLSLLLLCVIVLISIGSLPQKKLSPVLKQLHVYATTILRLTKLDQPMRLHMFSGTGFLLKNCYFVYGVNKQDNGVLLFASNLDVCLGLESQFSRDLQNEVYNNYVVRNQFKRDFSENIGRALCEKYDKNNIASLYFFRLATVSETSEFKKNDINIFHKLSRHSCSENKSQSFSVKKLIQYMQEHHKPLLVILNKNGFFDQEMVVY